MGVWKAQITEQFQSEVQPNDITIKKISLNSNFSGAITFNIIIKDAQGNETNISPVEDTIAPNSGWNGGNFDLLAGEVIVLTVSDACYYYFSFTNTVT